MTKHSCVRCKQHQSPSVVLLALLDQDAGFDMWVRSGVDSEFVVKATKNKLQKIQCSSFLLCSV